MTYEQLGFSGAVRAVPSDAADQTANGRICISKALCLHTAGTVKLTMENGDVETIALPAGVVYLRARRVWATPAPPTVTFLY